MKRYLSYYHPKMPVFLAYMLQQVEYNPNKFLGWVVKFPDLTKVMHRQNLVKTPKARALVALVYVIFIFYIVLAAWYLALAPALGVFTLLMIPPMMLVFTYTVVLFGWLYYEEPRRRKLINHATKTFKAHPGVKIAITGSYGKTSIKELLLTVLSQGKDVAATPGNKNVPVSHSAWSRKLTGEEDVLLIEYGEAGPGDIKKMAKLTSPNRGIITGLAPNHLDAYKSLDDVAKDLLSLGEYVDKKQVFVNDSPAFDKYDLNGFSLYSGSQVAGWKIEGAKTSYEGTSFSMKKNRHTIKVNSGLLGKHQVAPLALVAALAYDLGLSVSEIEKGLAETAPFSHRMQPLNQHGAWIIDDTYNGSLEGFRAGLELLKDLPAKRKIYVTPGLVDQGEETERVHHEIGQLIAKANPDKTVLMKNSTTQSIIKGLEEGGYKGDLQIEADPLSYYTNLEHILAAGDLVVMQNDWTDNYS